MDERAVSRDENGRKRIEKNLKHFSFRILLLEISETGYTGYGNRRELKNLLEHIVI
jgi:hypothetical protein